MLDSPPLTRYESRTIKSTELISSALVIAAPKNCASSGCSAPDANQGPYIYAASGHVVIIYLTPEAKGFLPAVPNGTRMLTPEYEHRRIPLLCCEFPGEWLWAASLTC